MKKSIFITALDKDEEQAKRLFQTVQRYGMETAGHFWVDDLKQMAWSSVAPDLLAPENRLWIISGSEQSFATPSIRFGLSMLAIMLHARKGHGFPILVVLQSGALRMEDLPTPLKDADIVTPAQCGAKVAAKANIPVKPVTPDYTLRVYPLPNIGLWFEVGPTAGNTWNGALFGIHGGEIDAHGVGPEGKIPERAVLEYPMKGLTLQSGDTEFTAWAVKNTLQAGESYYLRVKETPDALLFGQLPEGDDAEVYQVRL